MHFGTSYKSERTVEFLIIHNIVFLQLPPRKPQTLLDSRDTLTNILMFGMVRKLKILHLCNQLAWNENMYRIVVVFKLNQPLTYVAYIAATFFVIASFLLKPETLQK